MDTITKIEKSKKNILEYFNENNEVLTREKAIDLNLLLVGKSTIWRHFGGWNEFLKEMSLEPNHERCNERIKVQCKECGKKKSLTKSEYERSDSKEFFCTRSHAAIYNNKKGKIGGKSSKRKYYCQTCNKEIPYRRKYCKKHNPKRRMIDKPIKDLFYKPGANIYGAIRYRARTRYDRYNLPKSCYVCGYDKHTDVCHKKAISDFDENTLESVVNSKENLVALCRNHHWELDHDMLEL